MDGERCHCGVELNGRFDTETFNLRDDALLQDGKIGKFPIEMPGEEPNRAVQTVTAALDRILPESLDRKRGADRCPRHQDEAGGDQPGERCSLPTTNERAPARRHRNFPDHGFPPAKNNDAILTKGRYL
ncbi:MAG: hypothetical protein WA702_26220 [Bradyrhizobium sp.]|uniref:hypothetical protein n=1 Tax=Bradyrhizobium sp. TaxID=376 RepID=UPI003C7D7535